MEESIEAVLLRSAIDWDIIEPPKIIQKEGQDVN